MNFAVAGGDEHPLEAAVVYWQDLAKRRENGFALHGLAQALELQGRPAAAARARERFARAWAAADVPLTAIDSAPSDSD